MPLTLEIVTPDARVYSDTIDSVVIPTIEGEVGILPGHIPLLTQVANGELRVTKGAETLLLAVSGGFADTVTVDLNTGLLGHLTSSRRHKEDIKAMDDASETLYRLKPVTYRYKKEIDRNQALDYGLIAEEVAEVDPNLAIRNAKGEIETVRYNAINLMLLNEFLKEHRKVETLEDTVATLVTTVKEQAAQIQKVSAQVQMRQPQMSVARINP